MVENINNNNKPTVIPQVSMGRVGYRQTLPPPLWGRDVVSHRPSIQKKRYQSKNAKREA